MKIFDLVQDLALAQLEHFVSVLAVVVGAADSWIAVSCSAVLVEEYFASVVVNLSDY